ncbi:MAG: energy transducer TonB, partial [Planctomycetota bacterium]|nr:energy transducer TonB [Planctomycetota bacterium]
SGGPNAGGMSLQLIPGRRPEQLPLPMPVGLLAGETLQISRRLAEATTVSVTPVAPTNTVPLPVAPPVSSVSTSSIGKASLPQTNSRVAIGEIVGRTASAVLVGLELTPASPGVGLSGQRATTGAGGHGVAGDAGLAEGGNGSGTGSGGGAGQGVGTGLVGDLEPEYPPASIRHGEQGRVLIEALVRADGSVERANLIEPCPYPMLNEAALRAVCNARFKPARSNGQYIESWVKIPVRFVLK